MANKPSGHRVCRVLFVHVCSKLASDVISKVPCPVAKAPLLAEYSFFGQMGVEQAVLSAIENGRRFLDSDSDLACDTISKNFKPIKCFILVEQLLSFKAASFVSLVTLTAQLPC